MEGTQTKVDKPANLSKEEGECSPDKKPQVKAQVKEEIEVTNSLEKEQPECGEIPQELEPLKCSEEQEELAKDPDPVVIEESLELLNKTTNQYSGQKRTHDEAQVEDNPQKDPEILRNGCCKKCMKAFSRSRRSCLCQVPKDDRRSHLPSSGCKFCGCNGCNPLDKNIQLIDIIQMNNFDTRQNIQQVYSPMEEFAMYLLRNTNNRDIGQIGLGGPRRISSYISGKPAEDADRNQ
ncbi:unnamed protein product [Moneuplotes crassus]|uniref:Uncharacterized protein n=1 Tax=Euplotes crassus TaxID=5936 RepID=A0AAD1XUM0_EUPCR|nr:unnamed protein product [Moneuplotes crassus]